MKQKHFQPLNDAQVYHLNVKHVFYSFVLNIFCVLSQMISHFWKKYF